jgi:hypothetical protein
MLTILGWLKPPHPNTAVISDPLMQTGLCKAWQARSDRVSYLSSKFVLTECHLCRQALSKALSSVVDGDKMGGSAAQADMSSRYSPTFKPRQATKLSFATQQHITTACLQVRFVLCQTKGAADSEGRRVLHCRFETWSSNAGTVDAPWAFDAQSRTRRKKKLSDA